MIPYCILVIEDDDDRTFMEQLFVDYHRLIYHELVCSATLRSAQILNISAH